MLIPVQMHIEAYSAETAEVTSSIDNPPSRANPSRYKAKFLPPLRHHPHNRRSCIDNHSFKLFAQHCVLPYDPELPSLQQLEPWPEVILELHV